MLEWTNSNIPVEDALDFLDDCGRFYTTAELDAIIKKVNSLKNDETARKRNAAWGDLKHAAEVFFELGGAFEDTDGAVYSDIKEFITEFTRCE